MIRWLGAFVLTQAVEMPLYARALGPRSRRAWAVAFGASALTHPVVWFVVPDLWRWLYLRMIAADPSWVIPSPLARYACMAALAEAFAVLVEAAWLRAFGLRRALGWALGANAASVAVGLAVRAALGFP